jgi:hypothetical protein
LPSSQWAPSILALDLRRVVSSSKCAPAVAQRPRDRVVGHNEQLRRREWHRLGVEHVGAWLGAIVNVLTLDGCTSGPIPNCAEV